MTGETQNKPKGSVNPGRTGYDRNRRGRSNFNRGDTRGGRGRASEYRSFNRRGNEEFVAGPEGRNDTSNTYTQQRQYYRQDDNEDHYRQNVHVAKFDGKTLSDLNEFPDFNQCESHGGSSRNYRKSDARILNNSTEVKSFNWNGRDQSAHFTPRGADQLQYEQRNYNRGYANDTQLCEDNVFDNSLNRLNRGANAMVSQGRGTGRQYQRRNFEGPRRANIRPNNFPQPMYEEQTFPQAPRITLMSLYNNARFVCPPSMEGHEAMPGDSPSDHEESSFYKVKVNDDTLDYIMRIIYQSEFYFCNFNLKTDSFLRDKMDFNGYVSFETVLSFPRMMRLKAKESDLVEAIERSDKLECDFTHEMVRRVDSPKKWTNIGLFNECARVYNSYIYDDGFSQWFSKAEEYMKGFLLEAPKSDSDMQASIPMDVDPNSGNMIQPVVLPYSSYMQWSPMEFMNQPEMNLSMGSFQMIPFDMEQMLNQPEAFMTAELYDPNANEMFKDAVSSRADNEENITDAGNVLKSNQLDGSSEQATVAASGTQPDQSATSDPRKSSDTENFVLNPKELRNFRVSSKPQPAKYDRHSAVQHKNVKSEAHRDVDKQVKMGLKAYEHEQHKKSTSVHGALSQHPEAVSSVFVADLTKQPDVPKNSPNHLPIVVDGTRIVTDKKVIEQAFSKFQEGVPEPIPIERGQQPHSSVNGCKDAAESKGMRKDNKRPSGAKPKKSSGGSTLKGPAK